MRSRASTTISVARRFLDEALGGAMVCAGRLHAGTDRRVQWRGEGRRRHRRRSASDSAQVRSQRIKGIRSS